MVNLVQPIHLTSTKPLKFKGLPSPEYEAMRDFFERRMEIMEYHRKFPGKALWFAKVFESVAKKLGIDTTKVQKSNLLRALKKLGFVFLSNSEVRTIMNSDPEFKAASKETLAELRNDPAFKKKQSEGASKTLKKLHTNPKFKEENRERARLHATRLHQDPEFRDANSKRASERIQQVNVDPELVEKRNLATGKRLRTLNRNDEFKEKQRAGKLKKGGIKLTAGTKRPKA